MPGGETQAPGPAGRSRKALRFAVFVAILLTGFVALQWGPWADSMSLEGVTTSLQRFTTLPGAPLLFAAVFTVLTALGLPATFTIAGGVTVFGLAGGIVLSWLTLVAGATLSFALGRWLAHDLVAGLLGPRLDPITRLFRDRSGFMNLVRIRFTPMPFALVNYGIAMAGIEARAFVVSTTIALLPMVSLTAYVLSSLLTAAESERREALANLGLGVLALVALSFLPVLVRRFVRSREAPPPPPDGRS